MLASRYAVLVAASMTATMGSSIAFAEEEGGRRIEEVVVTAERRESTVSDTSISITAFGEQMLEDFGIAGADELVNFTPSTTRDNYDIRIRGIGRNFRALGGDPGVATYYNGVYSEDFGIAASEAALYDVARVEVLRGPQGTLYGRNAIGGALNYITNSPSYETEAEVRFMGGNLGTEEWYGMLSGPLIEDKLAYRFTAVRRDRDGAQDGLLGTEDTNTIGDQNLALAINWQMTDNMEFNVRYNDRDSDRKINQEVLVNEGTSATRGNRSVGRADIPTWQYAMGIAPVPDPILGFIPYTGPTLSYDDGNGGTVQGIYSRPGVDESLNSKPNAAYQTNPDVLQRDIEDLGGDTLTNSMQDETFKHNAVQANWSWDINDEMQLKWIGGWSDFDYTFLDDIDRSTSGLSIYNQNVKQSLENYSLELQFLWDIGEKLQVTTGAYYFDQDLRQQYDVRDTASQGRFTRPTQYGGLQGLADFLGAPVGLGSAPAGFQVSGAYGGDPFGRIYAIDNKVTTEAWAVFSQGTYTFNEEWALTLGLRYAKDDKDATEQRGGRTDIDADDVNALITDFTDPNVNPLDRDTWAFNQFCNGFYMADCATLGLTDLAVMNIFTGAASGVPTLDPQMPIEPTCELTDQDCTNPLNLDGLPISFADQSSGSDSWDDVNFRVNLDWSPNDNTLLYGSVTTGYRSGGYSLGLLGTQNVNGGVTSDPRSYDDETLVAYEIGYKGSLFDDTLQIFSSIYYYDYEGYQDEVQERNSAGSGDQVVINAGDAVNYGWELEGTWLPTDNWTLGGNYSWTQTEYQDDVIISIDDDPSRPEPLFDEVIYNLEGNDLKRIPEHKFTIWTGYDLSFPVGILSLNSAYSYTGDFYDSGVKRDLDRVRGRGRLDVSATWRDNQDRWNIRAFVDNVTDEGSARGIGTSTGFQDYQQTATYLYPRFYGVDVTYRFGHLL
jgi:iron complex outermembrane receptor protein